MKVLLICLSIFVLFAVSSADCNFKGKSLKTAETYQPPGQCAIYTCNGNNSVTGKTCPAVMTLKPCTFLPMDPSKPYPDCCPRHEC